MTKKEQAIKPKILKEDFGFDQVEKIKYTVTREKKMFLRYENKTTGQRMSIFMSENGINL